jgi:hypothetical protein
MVLKAKVDYRGAQRKLKRAQIEVLKAGKASVKDLATLGKAHAKSIAPYYSGKTVRLIKVFSGVRQEGPFADLVSQNSTPGRSYKGGTFNLVRWMHNNNGIRRDSKGRFAKKHIKSGDPRYMWTTEKYLRREKINVARQHFDKLNIR